MVQMHLVVVHTYNQAVATKFLFQLWIEPIHNDRRTYSSCRNFVFLQKTRNMRDTMIGRKENQVLPFPNFCIQIVEKITQIFVKTQIRILYLYRIRTERMSHVIW